MKKHAIGVFITCTRETDLAAEIQKAVDMGLECCQLSIWDNSLCLDEEFTAYVKKCFDRDDFYISALWAGWTGPCEWNFTGGPSTIGLVPAAYRFQRIQELKTAADFAKAIGVDRVITHVGFLPENPDHPDYIGTVGALRWLCQYMKAQGQYFLFETGQETPVTVLRFIEDSGKDNLGINLDPANLILYGKANPVDAVGIFGKYVRDVHAKDGNYPTNGRNLGEEKALGKGSVNFPALVAKLKEVGYDGPLTIEREIDGDEQIRDILSAKAMLEALI